jgi:hypothetical protein
LLGVSATEPGIERLRNRVEDDEINGAAGGKRGKWGYYEDDKEVFAFARRLCPEEAVRDVTALNMLIVVYVIRRSPCSRCRKALRLFSAPFAPPALQLGLGGQTLDAKALMG